LWSYGGLKSQDVEKNHFLHLSEKQPLTGKFSNFVPKGFIATPIIVKSVVQIS